MKKTIILLLSFLALTSSCSRIDLAVYFADTYVINKADDYFDLASDQKKWLKQALKTDIEKVKRTIFPQLAQELLKAADAIESQKTIELELAHTTYERVKNLIYDGTRIFAADAALFSEKLTNRQIIYFQKEFDEKLIDMRKDDSEKNTFKRYKKHFDTWLGYMTSAQKKSLENFVENSPSITKEKIYNRQTMAHDFVKAFPKKEMRKQYVTKVFTQYEAMRTPEFTKMSNAYNKTLVEYLTAFLNNMKADQRENLVENLRDRANQLIKLSKE